MKNKHDIKNKHYMKNNNARKKIITSVIAVAALMLIMGIGGRFIIGPMLDDSITKNIFDTSGEESKGGADRLTESGTDDGGESDSADQADEEAEETEQTENSDEKAYSDAQSSSDEEGEISSGVTGDGGNQNVPSDGRDQNLQSGSGQGNSGQNGSGQGNSGQSGSGQGNSSQSGSGQGNSSQSGSGQGNSGQNSSSGSAQDKIMDAATPEEIAQGSAILSKIDTGKFFSLMETDRSAAMSYLNSCLSASEIQTALELYSKYGDLLN